MSVSAVFPTWHCTQIFGMAVPLCEHGWFGNDVQPQPRAVLYGFAPCLCEMVQAESGFPAFRDTDPHCATTPQEAE